VFVPLAGVTRPELVVAGIAQALGADLGGTSSPLEALAERLGDDRCLLVLDNLEQVVEVAGDLGELLARCPGVAVLATSRTVLGLGAEQAYPVAPLPLPADPASAPVEEVAASPAVALLGRLGRSLDALGTGTMDMPERRRTLRATVAWSVGLLEEAERSPLETLAIFVDGWTVEAAAQVASLDEDRALDLTEALARHSLIFLDVTEFGRRPRMLETIRVFVAERLAARPDVAEIGRRHADYYRALAEQADRPLRGVSQSEWVERLQAEAGNLAAAVRWYLTHATLARCRTCSASCGPSGRSGITWVRPAPGSTSCYPAPTHSTPRPVPSCSGP
jgi:predicted ATPase